MLSGRGVVVCHCSRSTRSALLAGLGGAVMFTSDRARVLFFGAAIYALYISQGIVFEQLFSHQFGEPGRLQRWHYPEMVLLCNIVGNIAVALVMLWFTQPPPSVVPQKFYLAMAIPVFVASW